MDLIKTNITDIIKSLRSKLYQKLTAPIDAMWEQLYIESSQHYLIEKKDKTIAANTFCFEHLNKPISTESTLKLELVSRDDIPAIKTFLKEQVGMDDSFGYTENLVSRKEIYMLKESGVLIATSECRISDSQSEIADLGIIVNKDYQGRGIATELMQSQVNRVLEANRKPICSTTLDNIASKKAIEKSGFYCTNIIFDISFIDKHN